MRARNTRIATHRNLRTAAHDTSVSAHGLALPPAAGRQAHSRELAPPAPCQAPVPAASAAQLGQKPGARAQRGRRAARRAGSGSTGRRAAAARAGARGWRRTACARGRCGWRAGTGRGCAGWPPASPASRRASARPRPSPRARPRPRPGRAPAPPRARSPPTYTSALPRGRRRRSGAGPAAACAPGARPGAQALGTRGRAVLGEAMGGGVANAHACQLWLLPVQQAA